MPGFSLAHALRNVRSGEKHLALNAPGLNAAGLTAPGVVELSSPDFEAEGYLPQLHAGKGVGSDISPALRWSGVPEATRALVLIIEDVDVPLPRPIVHLAAELSAELREVPQSGLNASTTAPGVVLHRGALGSGYSGPRPIPGHGPHRYVFELFALDSPLALPVPASQGRIRTALAGHVIARGRLDGLYVRS
jgi:Raf kinase inhibitor-like YbhB/YbcL family protein